MVKTRRSNGENGDVDEGNYAQNDIASVTVDKRVPDWTQRELRSSSFRVTRKLQHWPTKLSRRLRTIKMPRIVFPDTDTEPEKYSRRRPMRVFFTGDTAASDRSHHSRRSRAPNKNYMEDSEDKPIQQNVRRSGRQRKLLHHSFNESWITNELKVRGYPGLYGLQGSSSSDESTSGDERQPSEPNKRMTRTSNGPTHTDEEGQSSRLRRTSARCSKKVLDASGSESEENDNKTALENKRSPGAERREEKMDTDYSPKDVKTEPDNVVQDSESNQGPTRSTRSRRTRQPAPGTKKGQHGEHEMGSDSESSDSGSGSDIVLNRQPRRSNRTRKPKPAFVEITQRPPRQAKTYTIRKKPYSLRERKSPKILRRKTIRSQSPSSSSSTSSSDTEADLNVSVKNKTKGRQKSKSSKSENTERALRDIQPIEVDGSVRFSSVGGLEEHIRCLREMVLFPLMYPDLFRKFNTRPAKGVLFHGPPGTGKTLLARALANECSVVGGRKVAFFMRKGADCLKKWVGESERHLKLLFQQANKMKPSIIFFDEIDALAPVRSVRQDQVHTSVVGTLLAEMDGLCDRGEVVVIGATNRLDAVDPALRRAGRFDRELHFPPPHTAARTDILHIYTKNWDPRPTETTLQRIAQITNGYGGSDLKALCSEAVLRALRRVYPQVYESEHALLIDAKKVEVQEADLLQGVHSLVAAGARTNPIPARALPEHVVPLLRAQVDAAALVLKKAFIPLNERRPGDTISSGSALLLTGPCAEAHLAPALLACLENCSVKELAIATLHSALTFTQEQALISVFSECRRADRGCVLFVRDIVSVWSFLGRQGVELFLQLWRSRACGDTTLLLATSELDHGEMPVELQDLFPSYKECVYSMREPSVPEVIGFLRPVMVDAPLDPLPVERTQPPPPLPRAPPPPPPCESEVEVSKRKRKEDYKLRELRIFLRDICRKLAANRRFYKFTKPVDLEEVTDYLHIIKQPMDLETMMTKVDMHRYNCAKEFLEDIDLICANALEYNPDRTSSDKQIRHEACSLRDHAHALIEVEMDSDFEMECREISTKRQQEGTKDDADLPSFIFTASNLSEGLVGSPEAPKSSSQNGESHQVIRKKRRRMNAWSKGLVKKPKISKVCCKEDHHNAMITDEDSKENKPITSTPLPNGDGGRSASSNDDTLSGDEQDSTVRPRVSADDSEVIFHLTTHGVVKSGVLESPIKVSDRKSSPKKRNSGQDSSTSDGEKIIINKTELENILYRNVKALRTIGLDALLDLHCQISTTVHGYIRVHDRSKLPAEIQVIVNRYVQQLAKK